MHEQYPGRWRVRPLAEHRCCRDETVVRETSQIVTGFATFAYPDGPRPPFPGLKVVVRLQQWLRDLGITELLARSPGWDQRTARSIVP
jgi:hypothetical protein